MRITRKSPSLTTHFLAALEKPVLLALVFIASLSAATGAPAGIHDALATLETSIQKFETDIHGSLSQIGQATEPEPLLKELSERIDATLVRYAEVTATEPVSLKLREAERNLEKAPLLDEGLASQLRSDLGKQRTRLDQLHARQAKVKVDAEVLRDRLRQWRTDFGFLSEIDPAAARQHVATCLQNGHLAEPPAPSTPLPTKPNQPVLAKEDTIPSLPIPGAAPEPIPPTPLPSPPAEPAVDLTAAESSAPSPLPFPVPEPAPEPMDTRPNVVYRAQLRLDLEIDGNRILAADPGGLGVSLGIRPGDVLLSVNGRDLRNLPVDLPQALKVESTKASYDVSATVRRRGRVLFLNREIELTEPTIVD